MVDWSFVGKNGFIIQYEDLISLIGWNIAEHVLARHQQDPPMDPEDRLLKYLNRESYDVKPYVHAMTGLEIGIDDMMESRASLRPNLLYAFKMFDAAYKNGIRKLYVHSNKYSSIIDQFVSNLGTPVDYVHGDIVPVLRNHVNCTYTTSNPENIRKCLEVHSPFALTIVDDFQYVEPIVSDRHLLNQLQSQNVYVQFTGVLSGGRITQ